MRFLAPPLCWSCESGCSPHEPLCRSCRGDLRWLGPQAVLVEGVSVWAPVAYEGPARALVGGLKYRGATALAEPMAAAICAGAPSLQGTLVAVPLHPRRLRKRGYNQALLLARALSRRSGLPVADALARSGPAAARQVGLDRTARLAGPPIACRGEVPADALVVDDVCTTGATLAACAAALREAGCNSVTAVTYARTLGR